MRAGSVRVLKADGKTQNRWRPTIEEGEDDDGKNFVPPDKWTAWPLEPELVPRPGEERAGDKDEMFTFKRREAYKPSRELEEILTGFTLKIAKERFEAREWEAESESSQDGSPRQPEEGEAQAEQDDGMEYSPAEAPIKSSIKLPSFSTPIISADDARSTRLLRPTIRHALSRLDSLLHALHLSRQACLLRYDSSDAESLANFSTADEHLSEPGTEPTTEAEDNVDNETSNPPSPKRIGRPRKLIEYPSDAEALFAAASPTKKSNRGRKKKVHTPREGETYAEMLVRLARESHTRLPFSSSPARRPSSRSASRSRSKARGSRGVSRHRSASASSRGSSGGQGPRLGLRDWSEVLGAAALVGFQAEVVERATRRCVEMFGEGMEFRVLAEGVDGGEGRAVRYAPDEIPDLGALSDGIDEELDEEVAEERASATPSPVKTQSTRHRSRSVSRAQSIDMETEASGEDLELYAILCPVRECKRHEEGFKMQKALRSHLKLAHKMGREEMERVLDEAEEEEMLGAVHRDGWMAAVKRKRGWRMGDRNGGVGRRRSRERGTDGEEGRESSGGEEFESAEEELKFEGGEEDGL